MDGKNTLQKSLRQIRHLQAARKNPLVGHYMQIGSWRLQENEEGDLVAVHSETEQVTVLAIKTEETLETKLETNLETKTDLEKNKI